MKDSWKEILFQKEWGKLLLKLHWDNYRTHTEINNENTKLWKKLRKQ